jgi:hypothetical protein
MGSSSKRTSVVGHRYYFGIHMGFGRGPVDAMHEILVGDKRAWKGAVTANTPVLIDQPNLFGGDDKEGGIVGTFDLMMGEDDQVLSTGLHAMLGATLPGYRRMVTAFFNGLISSNNPYPKPWKVRFNRALKGWDGAVFMPSTARVPLNAWEDAISVVFGGTTYGSVSDFRAAWNNANPGYTLFEIGEFVNVTGGGGSTNFEYSSALAEQYGLAWVPVVVGITTLLFSWRQNESSMFYSKNDEGVTSNAVMMPILVDRGLNFGETLQVRWDGGYLTQALMLPHGSAAPSAPVGYPWTLGSNANTPTSIGNADIFEAPYVRATVDVAANRLFGMNPAHIIYECYTNREWGRGLLRSKMDDAAFEQAATTLLQEGLGLCLKWVRQTDIDTFVQSVLDHIGAAIYVSKTTGLVTLRLIRADYDPDEIPHFDSESGLVEVIDTVLGTTAKSVNSITVKYNDPLLNEERTVTVNNAAALRRSGGVVNAATRNYPGIPTADLALRLGQRDLRVASVALRNAQVKLDRRAGVVEPGDVIALTDLSRGIKKTVFRVGKTEDGGSLDGTVLLHVVQDVFTLPATTFAAPTQSTWKAPAQTACVPAQQRVMEIPYFMLVRTLSRAELDYVNVDSAFIGALSERGQLMNAGFQIYTRDGPPDISDISVSNARACEI